MLKKIISWLRGLFEKKTIQEPNEEDLRRVNAMIAEQVKKKAEQKRREKEIKISLDFKKKYKKMKRNERRSYERKVVKINDGDKFLDWLKTG